MRKLLVIAGILMFAMPAFAWVDTFDYADTQAMLDSGNWSGDNISIVNHRLRVDGLIEQYSGSLLGHQTGPATDWYFNIESPDNITGGVTNYQQIGISNADGSKHVWFYFDSIFHPNKPITIDIDTGGTWYLAYWQTWLGSEAINDYVTELAGLWHIHNDAATGVTVYKDGQAVFTSGAYSYFNEPAMHFLVGVNYSDTGTPIDFNYIGTEFLGGNLQGTIIPDDYGDPANPDYSLIGVRIELRKGGNTVFSKNTLLNADGSFSINVPVDTYDEIAIKACSWLQKVVYDITVGTGGGTIGTVHLTSGDLNGDNEVIETDLSVVLANMDMMGN
ncbi:MAG: hypothetical protein WC975_00770 [Phycisphaerae bacterium]